MPRPPNRRIRGNLAFPFSSPEENQELKPLSDYPTAAATLRQKIALGCDWDPGWCWFSPLSWLMCWTMGLLSGFQWEEYNSMTWQMSHWIE
jgi:hypothetical protein